MTEAMTNYKAQDREGVMIRFDIWAFGFELSFGFWNLDFNWENAGR